MEASRRSVLVGVLGVLGLGLAACSSNSGSSSNRSSSTTGASGIGGSATSTGTYSLTFDHAKWQYDATNDVYYQLGAYYVTKPQATDYENLAVVVPGAYLTGTKNSDGTYTGTINSAGKVGDYTAKTAPIVVPVNTPGYAAQKPMTSYSYSDVSTYLKAGFVYVQPGIRGRDSNGDGYTGNAPWGVTDIKSAVRYLRYNAENIPGSMDRIFVFGHSGGGAQSAVMGASGDSPLYTPYLEALGAAMTDARGGKISDAIAGAMCWCPITSLDYANLAYEWNMGQFASTSTRASGTWTAQYSKDLATAWPDYLNKLGLKDAGGKSLTLDQSSDGIYLAGSYYDHLVSVVETSLNDFLSVTTFPYTPSSTTMAGMGGGAPGGAPTGSMSGAPSGSMSGAPSGSMSGAPGGAGASTSSTTYATLESYLAYLNTDSTWVTYDSATKKATVKNLKGFVVSQKTASKDVGAFDGPGRAQTENIVQGLKTSGLHFSAPSRDVMKAKESSYNSLSNWKSDYASDGYTSDFAQKDSVGTDVLTRVDMYNPLYYLKHFYKGAGSSTVAPHWRIRTGIMQGDTANTTEVNLALALADAGVKNVDFKTIWGQGHTMAELSGDAYTNFVSWVKQSLA